MSHLRCFSGMAGLYALFGDVVMPTLNQKIKDMFNYAGALN